MVILKPRECSSKNGLVWDGHANKIYQKRTESSAPSTYGPGAKGLRGLLFLVSDEELRVIRRVSRHTGQP